MKLLTDKQMNHQVKHNVLASGNSFTHYTRRLCW